VEPSDGPTLLFMHIPKTAGTSIRMALERAVPPERRVYIYGEPPGISEAEFASMPAESRERLRLVFGHFHFGLHRLIPGPSTYTTTLREPLERLLSLYYHYRTVDAGPVTVAARSMTFDEFVFSGRSLQTDNEMVRQLSGVHGTRFGTCSEALLETAVENIRRRFSGVLVMDHMDDAAQRLGALVGRQVSGIERLNTVIRRPSVAAIEPEMAIRVRELNRFDVALHEMALRGDLVSRPTQVGPPADPSSRDDLGGNW
jgi:hypothetical protein